jgi:hypothetical protein
MIKRLAVLGALLFIAAFAWIAKSSLERLVELRREAVKVRVSLVAEEVAAEIGRALSVGVPLARLRGMEDICAQSIRGREEIIQMAVQRADGQRLFSVPPEAVLDRTQTIRQDIARDGVVLASLAIHFDDRAVERVTQDAAALCLILLLSGGVMAHILFYRDLRLGPLLREQIVDAACEQVGRRDLTSVRTPYSGRSPHDVRVQWISRRTRSLNERYARVVRLATSLIATEPDSGRKADLQRLREAARGAFLYGGAEVATVHVRDRLLDRGMSLFFMTAGCAAIAVIQERVAHGLALTFACMVSAVVLAGLVFDSTLRQFGAWLFALTLAGVAVFLPRDSLGALIMAGCAAGFVVHATLAEETLLFAIAGIASGTALALLLDPISAWGTAGFCLVMLASAAWTMRTNSKGDSPDLEVVVRYPQIKLGQGLRLIVAGLCIGALIGTPATASAGLYTQGLAPMLVLAGAVLGVAFPLSGRWEGITFGAALLLVVLALLLERQWVGLPAVVGLSALLWSAVRVDAGRVAALVLVLAGSAGGILLLPLLGSVPWPGAVHAVVWLVAVGVSLSRRWVPQ